MTRLPLVTPILFAAALSAQVPTPPPVPVAPRAAPVPLVTPVPRISPTPWLYSAPDMNLDWSSMNLDIASAWDAQSLADYARDAASYAVDASSLALDNLNFSSDFNLNFGGAFGTRLGGGPVAWAQNDPADSLYRSARDQLNRGDYRKAAALFKSLPQKYPNSAYVGDAQYWQAFSLYRIGGTPELQEALSVLEARKPDAQDGNRNRVVTTKSGSTNGDQSVWTQVGIGRGYGFGRGQVDAAGLAARIAGVLSSRGMANDAAVKRALAAAGTSSCDQEDQAVRAEALNALMHNDPATGRQMATKILGNRDECSVPLRRNAVMLVANTRDDAAVATLLPVAKSDPSPSVRMAAVEYLVHVQTDAAVNAVIDVVRSDTSSQMQRVAVSALGQSSNPRARAEVRAIIENNAANEMLRVSALDGLQGDRMTADDAAWLRGLYARTTSPRVRERIISAVGQAGGDANNQWLSALVRNEDESLETRTTALRHAGRHMDVPTLAKLYDASSERPIRQTVIELLSQRTEPEALDKVVDIAKNGTDPTMRREAIAILARSKDPRASKLLLQLVDR